MVEVTPSKAQIKIKAGWIFFTLACLVIFPLLFAKVPNAGLNWYGIGLAITVAVVIDIWALGAPPEVVLTLLVVGGAAFLGKTMGWIP